ncbi:mate-domain-containing protein, partial [Haematococcus lacustris]
VSCPFAVGIAGSIRVGNLLGQGMPRTARLSGWLCVAIGGSFMATCAVAILAARHSIGRIFTNDPVVVGIIATIAPFLALFQVSDGLMGTAQGVLRGCGRQWQLMVYNFVGFWLCGVLLGYLLCFHAGLGVLGLWVGVASGDTVAASPRLLPWSLPLSPTASPSVTLPLPPLPLLACSRVEPGHAGVGALEQGMRSSPAAPPGPARHRGG